MTRSKHNVKDYLPLKPSVLHILIALSEGELHGYAVKRSVESSTEGVVRMGPGTLYESLKRLENDGLIREKPSPPAGERPHTQRRYYDLTRLGRSVLETELRRLSDVIEGARARRLRQNDA